MSDTVEERRSGGRGVIAGLLVTFVLGLVAMGWILTGTDFGRDMLDQKNPQTQDVARPQALAQTQPATPSTAPAPMAGDLAYRLAALEGRMASVEARSTGGSVSAPKAEALFIAIAARRRFERGLPLGALDKELADRFSLSEGPAVAALSAWSAKPITLAQLKTDFQALSSAPAAQQGWWDRLTSNIGSLIVVREGHEASSAPAHLMAEAEQKLARDDIAGAVTLLRKTSANAALSRWLADANRYVLAEQAVVRLEDRALDTGPALPTPPVVPAPAPQATAPAQGEPTLD